MRPLTALGGAFACVIGAVLLIFAGPTHTVVCVDARPPNSWLGDMLGHVDASNFTGCVVPTDRAWMIVSILLGIATVLLIQLYQAARTAG